MHDADQIWSNDAAELYRIVVGPLDNNVYVVRCRHSGEAVLIDAANEHERLLGVAQELGVRSVVQTHGHWDHIGALTQVRAAGLGVGVHALDAAMLPGYDYLLEDNAVHVVGELGLRIVHTPGHTPGSVCFWLDNSPVLFSGDTLFPGGPGATSFEGGDFSTIIASIKSRLFDRFDDATTLWPGHGEPTTIGVERPHLDEWIARGW